jgi:hypothetical protein
VNGRISAPLAARLGDVARHLKGAVLIEERTSTLRGETTNVATLSCTSYPEMWERPSLRCDDVREIGRALDAIAGGADPRFVFRTDERKKPNKEALQLVRALAYWSARARDESIDDAIRSARDVLPSAKPLKDSTLRRYAQDHRPAALRALNGGHDAVAIMVRALPAVIQIPSKARLKQFQRYLDRKGSRAL